MRYRTSITLQFIGLVLVIALADGQEETIPIVARAGSMVVTEQELLERFELLPRRSSGGRVSLGNAKVEFLLSVVAEKFLAQIARDRGLASDPNVLKEIGNIRRLLARDELYREEIQRGMVVTSLEISDGMRNAQRSLKVEYAFASDSSVLAGWLRGTIESDPTTVMLDTITVNWGEAETSLEEAAFALAPGERSGPIPSSVGWFSVAVKEETSNHAAESLSPTELRSRVERTIRLRNEERRTDEFVRLIVRNADGHANPGPFRLLVDGLRKTAGKRGAAGTQRIDLEVYTRTKEWLSGHLGDTLLVMGESRLSVGEAIDRFYASGTTFRDPEYPALEIAMNAHFREWTWQSILEDIALERGLDARPSVRRLLEMWESHVLSEALRRHLQREVVVSEVELLRMKAFSEQTWMGPLADIEIVSSHDRNAVAGFVGRKVEYPDEPVSGADRSVLSHVVLRRVDLTGFGKLSDVLWELPDRHWSHSIMTDSAFVSGRVTNRYPHDRIPERERDSLRTLLLEMKVQRMVTILTADAASERGFTMYEDRLAKLEVSATPMMTFRLLGFGGRMFAVPFVRPSVQWFGIEQEEGRSIP